jgi:F-type H+-transporting ATPase subunit delta
MAPPWDARHGDESDGKTMSPRAAAKRYARALFDVALAERADLDQIGRELSEFAALVSGNASLQRVLAHPAIPASRKRAVIEQLLPLARMTPVTSRLMLLLAERDRLVLLPDLADAYASRLMDHQQVVRAEVTTASALPPDRAAALQQGLASVTGRRVLLDTRIDPSIVGGAVARVGSTVYDGSVTTQLEKIRQRLTEADI